MSRVKIVSARSDVEVHLPDGRVLSGPSGAAISEFFNAIEFEAPVVGAVINHELHELTYPVIMDSLAHPVTMNMADGARIYRRSLIFLLEMAFADLFPKGKLTIDHSVGSGGFYCHITGRKSLNELELEKLKVHIQEMVDADLPFERHEVPIKDAIAQFEKLGYDDKVHLLKYRKKAYLTLYRLGGRMMDYMHGYMVPSTGYLRWFDLTPISGGFTLHFPRRNAPTQVAATINYPKLLAAFLQYGEWLTRLGIDNVGALNDAIASGRAHEIVLVSEALHELNVSDIAQEIAKRASQIILIAGPSSSGKTTFSRRLAVQLLALGISPFPLELDNYFIDRDKTPLGEDGQPDFETIESLDLSLLAENIESLIAFKKTKLPHYNFITGLRESGDNVQLKDGQPIILEGIHGMNPRLIPSTLAGRAFRIYASALTQLNLDRHNRVSTTDTRLIRRIVRDARERGYTATQTISRWESVRNGEKRHIFPYQENADVMFNSALVYELAVLKPLAEPLLRQVPYRTSEFIEARRLLAFLEWLLPIDAELIPHNSIVREFMGGSILKDFKIWKNHK